MNDTRNTNERPQPATRPWEDAAARPVVEIRGLVKRFGQVTALDGLDLEVAAGEIHGFLGPNGAGKTTTIRVLLGLIRHDAGTVSLLDGDPWAEATELHRRLAYVPGDVMLWPNLSGGEVIDLLGRLRGGLDDRKRADLLERFDLDPTKKGRTYSKGNRQKVALIAALARYVVLTRHEPACRNVDLVASVTQGGRFVVIEKWDSAAAVQEHLDSDLMTQMANEVLPALATKPAIDLYDTISAHDFA